MRLPCRDFNIGKLFVWKVYMHFICIDNILCCVFPIKWNFEENIYLVFIFVISGNNLNLLNDHENVVVDSFWKGWKKISWINKKIKLQTNITAEVA